VSRHQHSAFTGLSGEPSIGIRRTDYRQLPDLFLQKGSTCWLSEAKNQPSPFRLQSFLQSILFKQSERTAFEKL
jgi:hypothetical protein